jgi:hypothetical protein
MEKNLHFWEAYPVCRARNRACVVLKILAELEENISLSLSVYSKVEY